MNVILSNEYSNYDIMVAISHIGNDIQGLYEKLEETNYRLSRIEKRRMIQ